MEFKDLIELIKTLAWPTLVAVLLLTFRKPLARFIADLGKRATKLSVFEVSVEFAKIPNPPVPWSDPGISESYKLTGGDVTSTTVMELFQRMSDDKPWQYLVVDIGAGRTWLISRVFLFVVILRYLRGLRCVVFVETREELSKRLLGIMQPETVRIALAKRYPWFDQSLNAALSVQTVPALAQQLPKDKAESVVNAFLKDPRIRQQQTSPNLDEWEQLGTQPVWEHTKWLDLQRVDQDLRGFFTDRDTSQIVDSPDTPAEKRNRAILRRQTAFVALVNDRGEFRGLVDRQGFLEKMASLLADKSEDGDRDLE
jgi:hypothetical protein